VERELDEIGLLPAAIDSEEKRKMGRLYLIQLDGPIYSCKHCHSHLANCDELLSKVMPLLLFFPFGLPSVTISFSSGFLGLSLKHGLMGFVGLDCQTASMLHVFFDSETFLKL
jgi:hypothetical protein